MTTVFHRQLFGIQLLYITILISTEALQGSRSGVLIIGMYLLMVEPSGTEVKGKYVAVIFSKSSICALLPHFY